MRQIPFALTPFNLGSGVFFFRKAGKLPPKLKGKKDRLIAGLPLKMAARLRWRLRRTQSRILESKKMFKAIFKIKRIPLFAVFQLVSASSLGFIPFVDVTEDRNVPRQTRKLCFIFSFSRNRKLLYLSLSTKFTA